MARRKKKPQPAPQDLDHRYVIGIDLGTTNSAVAYVDLTEDAGTASRRPIQFFEIPQLVAQGETAARAVLPSFLYLPGEYDLPAGSTVLPWDAERAYAVGEFVMDADVKRVDCGRDEGFGRNDSQIGYPERAQRLNL